MGNTLHYSENQERNHRKRLGFMIAKHITKCVTFTILSRRRHEGDQHLWFHLPPRRLYIWKASGDNPENIVRNQIDYILINKQFGSLVLRAHISRSRCPIGSLLLATIKIKLAKHKNTGQQRKINYEKIRQSAHSKDKFGLLKKNRKPKWMTDEILFLMDEHRKCKYQGDHSNYKRMQKLIRKESEEHKTNELQSKHDEFNLHKKLKKIASIYRKKNYSVLKEAIWIKYIDLFSDNRSNIEKETNNNEITVSPITKEEIMKAIQNSKTNKAVGPDEIPTNLLKLLEKEEIAILHKIFNTIYDTGTYPAQWLTLCFVPLSKKSDFTKVRGV
ncbi:hypothetical protein ACFW04_013999 [Cataglyphis niger]